MTKPDTKEIRNDCDQLESSVFGEDSKNLNSKWLAQADCAILINKTRRLCNAYDEAQKEIEIRDVALQFCNSGPAKIFSRTSTLEDLLREVLKNNCRDEYGCCASCHLNIDEEDHFSDCLFTRIQKELGEG